MEETPPYRLDVPGLEEAVAPEAAQGSSAAGPRPWVGVHFDCCGVYQRIYRQPEAKSYQGRCPRCGRKIKLAVGPGGTDARFFTAQ